MKLGIIFLHARVSYYVSVNSITKEFPVRLFEKVMCIFQTELLSAYMSIKEFP